MTEDRWQALLVEPSPLETDAQHQTWFDAISDRLLNGARLMVGGVPHRFTEIEFYYHGGHHLDPFTHRDPHQKQTGSWYFHRTGGVYRGGSFKGVDLTFGGADAFGGVLIRGIARGGDGEGDLVDGPSLTVERLLRLTGSASVASLDASIAGRSAWDPESPVHVVWVPIAGRRVLRTARIGLSLKRLRHSEAPLRFILRRYRHLTEPRRIAKGKAHMALALHADGKRPAEIREITGGTRSAIDRYVADFAVGEAEPDFSRYFGLELRPPDLCRLHGLWHARFGRA